MIKKVSKHNKLPSNPFFGRFEVEINGKSMVVEYEPDSMHAQARGKFADNRRISTNLLQVGLGVADRRRALAFFRDSLGVGDYIELLPQGATTRLYFEVPNLARAIR